MYGSKLVYVRWKNPFPANRPDLQWLAGEVWDACGDTRRSVPQLIETALRRLETGPHVWPAWAPKRTVVDLLKNIQIGSDARSRLEDYVEDGLMRSRTMKLDPYNERRITWETRELPAIWQQVQGAYKSRFLQSGFWPGREGVQFIGKLGQMLAIQLDAACPDGDEVSGEQRGLLVQFMHAYFKSKGMTLAEREALYLAVGVKPV